MQTILHVGCGVDPLPTWLDGFFETRLDINPAANPDIVASMLAMGEVGLYDAVLCQHALEHLYPHEVGLALTEFLRVLKPGGTAFVIVPDLEGVTPTEDVLFTAAAGPITGLDLIYGFRPWLRDNPHMAHHTGFVSDTLRRSMLGAGFSAVHTKRAGDYNLVGVGVR